MKRENGISRENMTGIGMMIITEKGKEREKRVIMILVGVTDSEVAVK